MPQFDGPFRPRLELPLIVPNQQIAALASPGALSRLRGDTAHRLVWGWVRYFGIESAISAGCAAVLLAALMSLRRAPRRAVAAWMLAGVATTTMINLTGALVDARGASTALHRVRDLADLVGTTATPPGAPAVTEITSRRAQAIVLGDSVAAGAGNPPVSSPSPLDTACGRSVDSFALALGRAIHWTVDNLACGGATVERGLAAPQPVGGTQSPAQLSAAMRIPGIQAIIINIGANDVQWSALLKLCAAAPNCGDRASAAYFRQGLARLTEHLAVAFGQLAAAPGHPRIVVNQYYNPFGTDVSCLNGVGLTAQKIKLLSARLNKLNQTLADSAAAYRFTTARPDFAGHQLCTAQPDVQGPQAPAPFHPTPAGETVIALADQHALQQPHNPGQDGERPADTATHY